LLLGRRRVWSGEAGTGGGGGEDMKKVLPIIAMAAVGMFMLAAIPTNVQAVSYDSDTITWSPPGVYFSAFVSAADWGSTDRLTADIYIDSSWWVLYAAGGSRVSSTVTNDIAAVYATSWFGADVYDVDYADATDTNGAATTAYSYYAGFAVSYTYDDAQDYDESGTFYID